MRSPFRILAEVLPQDKAFNVQRLQLEGKKVAMSFSSVTVIANANRLKRWRPS